MNPAYEFFHSQNRRQFFHSAGLNLGGIALAGMLGNQTSAAEQPEDSNVHPPLPGFPHFAPTAKRLIYIHTNGAPSQLDLFDYKPKLRDHFDKDLPDSVRNCQRITTMTSGQSRLPVAPSKFKFEQCGESGIWMSELLPHMKEIADDITLIKSVHTDAINHDPACTFVMTGSEIPGKPSLGSWISWPGQRESGSASVRRFHSHIPQRQSGSGTLHANVEQRFPAHKIRWSCSSRDWRPGSVREESSRRQSR